MSDKEFLIWLHHRLTEVHGENEMFDYMNKLRSIIEQMDDDQHSLNNCCKNIQELSNEYYERVSK